MIRIEFLEMVEIADALNDLRHAHPIAAKIFDKCLFDVMNNHTPKCGHGTCSCQTMTFEKFHDERNVQFGTTSEVKCFEFN